MDKNAACFTFGPRVTTKPFLPILEQQLKERGITWNSLMNTLIPLITCELVNQPMNKARAVKLNLGTVVLED